MNTNGIHAETPSSPDANRIPEDDASRVECALDWLSRNFERQPSLAEAARHVGWSESHFQRRFRSRVGLSPKKFVQFLTLERAKEALARSRSVLDAAYDAGLSGAGRLHDLFVNVEAMTPGEYKHRGRGLTIRYGTHPSPFGQCLIMRTARGVCGLAFTSPARSREAFAELARGIEAATFVEDAGAASDIGRRLFGGSASRDDITLQLRGTAFQLKVWRALLAVPPGCVTSYGDLGGPRRSAAWRACGGQRGRGQPRRLDHPLPPGHPGLRRARRIPLGTGTQARDAEPRGRRHRTAIRRA